MTELRTIKEVKMVKVEVKMLAIALSVAAAEDAGLSENDEITRLCAMGLFEHAHGELRRRPGVKFRLDYVLCSLIERNIGEALYRAKRLSGWGAICLAWPGRTEEQDYVDLPEDLVTQIIPKGWTIYDRGRILSVAVPGGMPGTWTFLSR
ncbi:MAG TPA: hypothetical protein P5318_20165 [Candidatus Hydrogenedentes bacterium]|nr:hypothetical protein [Candidatus Hydrogenedentota bacterium]